MCVCVFDVASRRGWIYCSPGRLALHATILTFSAVTDSCSNLKLGFSTINVHTSSQKRYVCRWPYGTARSNLVSDSIPCTIKKDIP